MQIDFNQPVLDLDGEPLRSGPGASAAAARLGDIISSSLLTDIQGDKPSEDDKAKRFDLALKYHVGGKVDVDVTDAAFILARLAKTHATIVYGRVKQIFNAEPEKAKK